MKGVPAFSGESIKSANFCHWACCYTFRRCCVCVRTPTAFGCTHAIALFVTSLKTGESSLDLGTWLFLAAKLRITALVVILVIVVVIRFGRGEYWYEIHAGLGGCCFNFIVDFMKGVPLGG